jgi:hypothetical protein
MFALLLAGDPDGLAAAAHFEEEEYEPFAAVLRDTGLTEIRGGGGLRRGGAVDEQAFRR